MESMRWKDILQDIRDIVGPKGRILLENYVLSENNNPTVYYSAHDSEWIEIAYGMLYTDLTIRFLWGETLPPISTAGLPTLQYLLRRKNWQIAEISVEDADDLVSRGVPNSDCQNPSPKISRITVKLFEAVE